jgi:hypothetical protein
MGKVVQALQSVNCLGSHAPGHERHVPFIRLVGVSWIWLGYLGLVGFCSWYATSAKPLAMVLDLATCGMHVSFDRFWLRE